MRFVMFGEGRKYFMLFVQFGLTVLAYFIDRIKEVRLRCLLFLFFPAYKAEEAV